jgi:hypothetical protein
MINQVGVLLLLQTHRFAGKYVVAQLMPDFQAKLWQGQQQ